MSTRQTSPRTLWNRAKCLACAVGLLAIAGAGCGDAVLPTASGSADAISGDQQLGGLDSDPDLGDAPGWDTTSDANPAGDAIAAGDAATATDAVDAGAALPPAWTCEGTGEPGCPCLSNDDCNSAHCIDTPDEGYICTTECQTLCPAAYICVAEGGTDVAYLCRPKWPVLCNPCDTDADCAAVGVGKSLCVDRGPLGHFCGAACSADVDCPSGTSCQSVTSAGGKTGSQCMPSKVGGIDVDCTCSYAAKLAKLGTSCAASSATAGKPGTLCAGVRQCGIGTDGALSACSAVSSPEVCNGKDDDCDGAIDESACDDNNPCTSDWCDVIGLACAHTPTVGACDADANACTEGDSCKGSQCQPGPAKKCDDGNPCTLDSCDIAKGCTATLDNGSGCDDGDPCTVGDICAGGQCAPGKPKLCPAPAICHLVACSSETGKCESTDQANASPCNDESACTQGDSCLSGFCVGGTVDCNDANPCTLDNCDSVAGCQHAPSTAPCDDGNACTVSDSCSGGSCVGSPKPKCDDGNLCTDDLCDPKSGCVSAANTSSCDDGNACTSGDTCKAGACVPGTSVCQCQADSDCKDDNNHCNGSMYCDKTLPGNYQCKTNPATIVVCDTSGDPTCLVTTCNTATGKCAPLPTADGKPCNADFSICTVADSCTAGVCTAGTPLACNDGNPCTTDACDAINGCAHQANSSPCDADANGCTGPDSCKNAVCVAGPPISCDDGSPCTADSCDKQSASCVHDGQPANGFACDADGSLCTAADSCSGGTCKPGSTKDCDDFNPCTVDTCDAALGCQHTTLGDKSSCAQGKWCISGTCVKAPNCGDSQLDPGEECDDGNPTAGDGCTGCVLDKPPQAKVGELLITEVMARPTQTADEWVEVLNTTDHTVDLNGLYFGDAQFYHKLNKVGGFYVKAGQYVVLSAVDVSKTSGGPVPNYIYGYSTSGIAFNNDGDMACISLDTACSLAKQLTAVTFGVQPIAGYSHQLDPTKLDLASATSSSNWCLAKTIFGSKGDRGTPQGPNTSCP